MGGARQPSRYRTPVVPRDPLSALRTLRLLFEGWMLTGQTEQHELAGLEGWEGAGVGTDAEDGAAVWLFMPVGDSSVVRLIGLS